MTSLASISSIFRGCISVSTSEFSALASVSLTQASVARVISSRNMLNGIGSAGCGDSNRGCATMDTVLVSVEPGQFEIATYIVSFPTAIPPEIEQSDCNRNTVASPNSGSSSLREQSAHATARWSTTCTRAWHLIIALE